MEETMLGQNTIMCVPQQSYITPQTRQSYTKSVIIEFVFMIPTWSISDLLSFREHIKDLGPCSTWLLVGLDPKKGWGRRSTNSSDSWQG